MKKLVGPLFVYKSYLMLGLENISKFPHDYSQNLQLTSANNARVQTEDLNILQSVGCASAVWVANCRLSPSCDDYFISCRDVVAAVAKTTDCHVWTRGVHFSREIQEIGVTVICQIWAPSTSKEYCGIIYDGHTGMI